MSDKEAALLECRKLIGEGASLEAILGILRTAGYSKVHSIKALVDLGQATLGDAKEIVHKSDTWKDVRERDEDFQTRMDG